MKLITALNWLQDKLTTIGHDKVEFTYHEYFAVEKVWVIRFKVDDEAYEYSADVWQEKDGVIQGEW